MKMRTLSGRGIVMLAALATLLVSSTASAQIRQVRTSSSSGSQTINFNVGYFALKGLDSRVSDDVLLADVQNEFPLDFLIKDFNNATFGGEYLLGVGPHFEAGLGIGFYQRTVTSAYSTLTHSNGDDILQDLKLRQVPVTFTARFLPLPRGSAVEPYIGAGVVAIRWHYSETGEFVDVDRSIFPGRYVADGTAAGPTVLAGIRAPIGSLVVGGEARWQKAEAKGLLNPGFLADRLDLGGWTGNFTVGFRF
jgi:opacity protein-like surface antigen